MRLFGITGWSGSGKTELILRLIKHFRTANIRTSIIKHAHHAFQIDKPEKDSFRYREHGCVDAVVSSSQRWAVIHENHGKPEASLNELISHLQKTDLILVEGFKKEGHPKLEVWRNALNQESLAISDSQNALKILAVATSDDLSFNTLLPLNDTQAIADFILQHAIDVKDFKND